MAVPLALSFASAGALVDAVLFHMLRQTVDKQVIRMLFLINVFVICLAMSTVIVLILVHPPEIIASSLL